MNNAKLEVNRLYFIDSSGYPLPGKIAACLLCSKPYLVRMYTGAPDQICGECFRTYEECAVVRCSSPECRGAAICRLKPATLDNGFTIRPRSVLHSSACNCCQPGLRESVITEIESWEKLVRPRKAAILVPNSYTRKT